MSVQPPRPEGAEWAAEAPVESAWDQTDYTISYRYVDLFGLTIKSLIEFQQHKPSFSKNLQSALSLLSAGRMYVAFMTIFRNAIKGEAISVKNIGSMGYLPSLEGMIAELDDHYREWKKNVEQLEDESSRLKGLFDNVVCKWKTPLKEMRKTPSPTALCVRTFYRYVESEKNHHAESQKSIEEMLKKLMEVRIQLEAIHQEIRRFFETSSPVQFKTDCFFPTQSFYERSPKRRVLQGQLDVFKEQFYNAVVHFETVKKHLQEWIAWCTYAESLASKAKLNATQLREVQSLCVMYQTLENTYNRNKEQERLHYQTLEGMLKWAHAKITEFNQNRVQKKALQETEQQVGLARTEDTVFEEGAAQQVHIKAKDVVLRLKQVEVFFQQWRQPAKQLNDKLLKQASPGQEAAAQDIAKAAQSPSKSSSSLPLKKTEKVQFSDPPGIPPSLSFGKVFEDDKRKEEAVEIFIRRWADPLRPPKEMNVGNIDPKSDTLEAKWVLFDQSEREQVLTLVKTVLLQMHYPCQTLNADYLRFLGFSKLTSNQKYLCNLDLRELKTQTLTYLQSKYANLKGQTDLAIESLKSLSSRMELSPPALVQDSTNIENLIYLEAMVRIDKAKKAQEAIKEMIAFLSKTLEEDRNILEKTAMWLDGLNLFDVSVPLWAKNMTATLKNGTSYSAWARKAANAQGVERAVLDDQLPGDVLKASLEATKYVSIRSFFNCQSDSEMIEIFTSKFLETPALDHAEVGRLKQRQEDNLNALGRCFFAQAREINDTTELFKAFLGDLHQLNWDAARLWNMDFYDQHHTPRREKDLQELEVRWNALTTQNHIWMPFYTATTDWLTAVIAVCHRKQAQREWYHSQTELTFRTTKEVQNYINLFTEAAAYFEIQKMNLEHLYKQQIIPAVDEIASWINSLRRQYEGNWFTPSQKVVNPFLSSPLPQAKELPPQVEAPQAEP